MKVTKGRLTKLVSLVTSMLLLLGSMTGYAQSFTDVPDNHWAAEYIQKVYSAGIVGGYEDATFRPNDNVTNLQALIMMARLFGLTQEEKNLCLQEKQELLNNLQVPSWAQQDIAVALMKGIISEEVLTEFVNKNTINEPIKREKICIYLTRAMGLEQEALNKTFYFLKFNDLETITDSAKAYVVMMTEKGIINASGDANGNFNPQNPVSRAEMAKMLSLAYDYIKENNTNTDTDPDTDTEQDNDTAEEEETDKEEIKTIEVSGTITDIMDATEETYIIIEDSNKKKTVYKIHKEAEIKIDGEEVGPSELVEGLVVKAEVTDGNIAVSLSTESFEEEYVGKIKTLYRNEYKLTVEYEHNGATLIETLLIDEDVQITLDGEEAFVYHLREGDIVDLKVKNKKIIRITANSKDKHISGTLKEIEYDEQPMLVVEDSEGEVYSYPIDEAAVIKRNNRDVDFVALKNGDKLEVDVTYDMVTEINAETVKIIDEGTLRSILISAEPEITIVDADGEESTYYISKDLYLEVDGELNKTIYDLRLGHYVKVVVESNEIVALNAQMKEVKNKYIGNVVYINEDIGLIVIKQKSGETKEIFITEDTKFADTTLTEVDPDSLSIGSEIMALGKENGGLFGKFLAESIIITD